MEVLEIEQRETFQRHFVGRINDYVCYETVSIGVLKRLRAS